MLLIGLSLIYVCLLLQSLSVLLAVRTYLVEYILMPLPVIHFLMK